MSIVFAYKDSKQYIHTLVNSFLSFVKRLTNNTALLKCALLSDPPPPALVGKLLERFEIAEDHNFVNQKTE